MRNRGVFLLIAALAVCILTGCGRGGEVKESSSIVVVSPHPNGFIKPLIHEFERESGIEVKVIECGTSDAVDMIKNGEDIDVMWGGSILTVGPFSDLFYSYKTPLHLIILLLIINITLWYLIINNWCWNHRLWLSTWHWISNWTSSHWIWNHLWLTHKPRII